MKYNINNKPLECFMTNSMCYKNTTPMVIKGILLHSTGANNPYLKRYVQPTDDNNLLIEILGKNQYGNDWNHIQVEAGVNAWIGLDANKTVRAVQTMPWDYMPWGCGAGPKGSCNNGWIQIEICEDDLRSESYFNAIYKETCELIAYLCKLYNLNPKAKAIAYNNLTIPVLLSHSASRDLGMGSNHKDIEHWFSMYNKTLNDIATEVESLLNPTEEDDDMTQEKFNEFMDEYLRQQAERPGAGWSETERSWAAGTGLIKGDDTGKMMYKKFITREECIVLLFRLYTLIKNKVKKV